MELTKLSNYFNREGLEELIYCDVNLNGERKSYSVYIFFYCDLWCDFVIILFCTQNRNKLLNS